MPVHGEEKRLQMARSILPAKTPARRTARSFRRLAHHRHRALSREAMAHAPLDDGFDERPLGGIIQRDISMVVMARRSSDKLGPFLRWANAQADELGATPEARVAAMRARLPKGVIGEHALSHLTSQPAFEDDPLWRAQRYAWREAAARRPAELQSLRDRLVHGIGQRLDQVGELNAAIKASWVAPRDDPERRPRLLAGAHDVVAFVDSVIVDVRPTPARQRDGSIDQRTWRVVLAFAGIDTDDPFARGPQRRRR